MSALPHPAAPHLSSLPFTPPPHSQSDGLAPRVPAPCCPALFSQGPASQSSAFFLLSPPACTSCQGSQIRCLDKSQMTMLLLWSQSLQRGKGGFCEVWDPEGEPTLPPGICSHTLAWEPAPTRQDFPSLGASLASRWPCVWFLTSASPPLSQLPWRQWNSCPADLLPSLVTLGMLHCLSDLSWCLLDLRPGLRVGWSSVPRTANKVPQTRRSKTTEVCPLTVLEATV